MPVQVIDRSYYGAAQRGREDRQAGELNMLRQQAAQQEIAQANVLGGVMRDPNSTPEQFARAGQPAISNSLLAIQRAPAEQQAEQVKQFATQMTQAAQFSSQAPAGQTKAFIEKNFPMLAQTYGPEWSTATDDQVRTELQGIAAKFSVQAGIGPQAPKGVGAMYKYTSKDGKGVYGDAADVRGQPVYESADERAPPSGYRYNAGRLEPIPGGPADPNTPNTRDDTRVFAKADKLRDEFNTQSKDFIAVGDSFSTVKAAAKDPTAAGDLSLIFAYMKMLDPNSVVREQEFANAQNAAGVPDQIRNQWNKILEGERLNPDQRADFIGQAEKVYKVRKVRNEGVVKRYTEIAKRNKVNPDDVVGDLSVFEDTAPGTAPGAPPAAGAPASGQQAPVQIASEQEYAALKPGTSYIAPDGSTRTKR